MWAFGVSRADGRDRNTPGYPEDRRLTTQVGAHQLNKGMPMKIHELKTWPEYFNLVIFGIKRAEIRLDDRNINDGDVVVLREYLPDFNRYSGRKISFWVLKALRGGCIPGGYVFLCLSEKST